MSPPHDHEEAAFYYRWLIRAAVRRKRQDGDYRKALEIIERHLPIYRQRWRAFLEETARVTAQTPSNDNTDTEV
ncbi:MAG: hypothetical protein E1N59_407 [Puniceicoccaceae bacterium 5H]|nr:MAG: hypothetical protein E1N59_407 [Puniceicoccaceae bacterium 5H]